MSTINPRVDLCFKKIFGVEENKDLLISLINSIVSDEDKVADITLLNPYNVKNFRNDKLSILDIKAKNHEGKLYNIEMQITDEKDYDKRALYYWGKLYTNQLRESDSYSELSKAIGIHILNFSCVSGTGNYHNRFVIKEKESNIHYFKDLELHTIELEKFTENLSDELTDLVAKMKTSLDIWSGFLTKYDLLSKEGVPQNMKVEPIDKALRVLEVMSLSDIERDVYDNHLKWMRIQINTVEKVREDSLAEGRAEGRAEGEAVGIEKGIEQGRVEGEVIGINKGIEKGIEKGIIATAKNMLEEGLGISVIAKYTGLSEEEIKKLK